MEKMETTISLRVWGLGLGAFGLVLEGQGDLISRLIIGAACIFGTDGLVVDNLYPWPYFANPAPHMKINA